MPSTHSDSQPRGGSIYPLAFPKGIKHVCELCQKPATVICERCRVTYYCDGDHQQSDWYGIHEKICQSLIPLRSPLQFLPSEEERKKRDDDLKEMKVKLLEYTRSVAQKYLFEGDYQRAIPGAMTSLKLAIEMYGLKSVDLIPSYLILGEASQGLGSLSQAQEYLSQAEWTVIKNKNCPLSILHRIHRNMAMLQMMQNNIDEALRNLANDIYYSSEEYGTEHFKVSGGYFLMGNIYFKLEKMDIADSLYRQVIHMWYNHLKEIVTKKTQISELDSILGIKDDDDMEHETIDPKRSEELASEAEAKKVLYTIYEIRKNETNQDFKEIIRIEHGLSMVHFLGKDYKSVEAFTELLNNKPEVDESVKNDLQRVVSFIKLKSKN